MLKPVQQDKPRELLVAERLTVDRIRFLPSVEMTRREGNEGREADGESV
jgi:hypothetical protein